VVSLGDIRVSSYIEPPNIKKKAGRQYAKSFTLCDAFFSSLEGPSAPNHLYSIAAQSGGLAANYGMQPTRGKETATGTLPQVCWITPTVANSEHPPANVQTGMWYVTGLINAVMQSSYWNHCAIILTWDDYGGFYDHVPPMQVDQYGYGFRVRNRDFALLT
jgi:phospholipase C